jgi:hypothetical protein
MNSGALAKLRNLDISPGCKGDILTGGKAARELQEAIRARFEGEDNNKKKRALCIQRNF